MLFVLFLACAFLLQRARSPNIHPHRAGVSLPNFNGISRLVCTKFGRVFTNETGKFAFNAVGVFPRLAHGHKVVGYSVSGNGTVLYKLLVQQADGLRALHGGHRVLPNGDLAMVNPPAFREEPDKFATEIANANEAVTRLCGGQVHAVERNKPARLRYAEKFSYNEAEVFNELVRGVAVAKVAHGIGIGVKACKRRAENAEAHGIVLHFLDKFAGVPQVRGVVLAPCAFLHIRVLHFGSFV